MIQKTFSWEEWKNEVSRLLPRKKYNQLLVWLCENKKKFTPHNVAYWSHKVLLRNPMYWVPCPPDREYISCWVDEMYKIVHSRSRKPSAPGYRSDLWDHGITVFSEVCNRWVAIPIGDRKKHILIKGNVVKQIDSNEWGVYHDERCVGGYAIYLTDSGQGTDFSKKAPIGVRVKMKALKKRLKEKYGR